VEPEVTTEQPPGDSVENRIANIFGGETEQPEETQAASEPEAPSEETKPPADETFEAEIDGEKFTLPKKLEKSFMQEKDYTQKSQSLAEQRRTLDLVHDQARIAQMSQKFQGEVAPELQQLHMLETVIKQAQSQDWSSMQTEELLRKRLELDNLREQRNTLFQAVQAKHQEFTQKQQGEYDQLKTKSLEMIKKRIPTWTEATAKEIREHALNDGYTEAELASILDPRHAVTLWKAQQFDKLQANAKKTVQEVKSVKTTPANPMPQQVKEKLNFNKAMSKTQPGSRERQRVIDDRIAKIFG
jgi:hypothetical protein